MHHHREMTHSRVLLVPGLGGSGPTHWQTLWAAEHGYDSVEQRDWAAPDLDEWVATLDAAVHAGDEVVLVGHSLGCHTIAHWAAALPSDRVIAALLVAPPDIDYAVHNGAPEIAGFGPPAAVELPFPTTVVLSRTDPWGTYAAGSALATVWGARLIDVGDQGHLNVASGHGPWPEGHSILTTILTKRSAAADETPGGS